MFQGRTEVKSLIWILTIFLLIVPSVALSQDLETVLNGQVAFVKEGENAPFDGTLLDDVASANLVVQLEQQGEVCQTKIDRAVSTRDVEWQLKYDFLNAELKNLRLSTDAKITARDDIISLQSRELERIRKPRVELYFAGGVVAGITLTVLSGWAIGQVAQASGN